MLIYVDQTLLYNSVDFDHSEMRELYSDVNGRINCCSYGGHSHAISDSSVDDAIKKLKIGKSDGYDGLTSDYIINGTPYRYLSYKYGIGIHVWHLPLCKLYKCFDLFLLNHHKTIANGVFIRDLCLLRENNIVDDDQDLTSTELTFYVLRNIIAILFLC